MRTSIYTESNLQRAAEIWQYMYIINLAASAYQWENVTSYDLTFRHLMAYQPQRSWAKTYNQGWNLAMRDPISKGQENVRSGVMTTASSGGFDNSKRTRSWRDDCCWKYNWNKCKCQECDYDHQCTYCVGWNHGYYNCRKRLNKNAGGRSGSGGSGGNSHCHSTPKQN